MPKSIEPVVQLLSALSRRARACGLSDSEWASRAGIRKETLSRLRQRQDCDLATLRALAGAVGARIGVLDERLPETTADGNFPARVSRDYESQLVELCSSGSVDLGEWANAGPRFFMAGLAVMLASAPAFDRRALLDLAERLHVGASEPAVFEKWLEKSPVRPSRFLPLLRVEPRAA